MKMIKIEERFTVAESKEKYLPILEGEGSNDYTRYMKTDLLLSLQRTPEQLLHRDEILFQIVHQSTELWLKLNHHELSEAILHLKHKNISSATALLQRSAFGIELITQQLEMLKFMTPADFQGVRPALGNGSGLESPGWQSLQKIGEELNRQFESLTKDLQLNLTQIYTNKTHSDLFNLMEALVDWDEKVSLWRVRHYKIAVRTIGLDTVGTKGKPIEKLTRLINFEFFPTLWRVRTKLTHLNEASY